MGIDAVFVKSLPDIAKDAIVETSPCARRWQAGSRRTKSEIP